MFDQDELSTQAKMKQIRSIYRKEVNTKKDEKNYVGTYLSLIPSEQVIQGRSIQGRQGSQVRG